MTELMIYILLGCVTISAISAIVSVHYAMKARRISDQIIRNLYSPKSDRYKNVAYGMGFEVTADELS